jgi:hypothetical protein
MNRTQFYSPQERQDGDGFYCNTISNEVSDYTCNACISSSEKWHTAKKPAST